MLGEIIWKDEKEEIVGIEKIMPCRFGSLLEKSISSYKMPAKEEEEPGVSRPPWGLMRYTAVLCGPWAVYLC